MREHIRVLIVDDIMSWHQKAEEAVKRGAGVFYKTAEYCNGYTIAQGLKLLKSENPDIVLLDINFNEDDGKNQDGIDKFLVPIRGDGTEVPVLCWSSDRSFRWKTRKAGADDFLIKYQAKNGTHLAEALDALICLREQRP